MVLYLLTTIVEISKYLSILANSVEIYLDDD